MTQSSIALARHTTMRSLLPWLVWGMSSLFVSFQMFLQTSPSVMIADLQRAFAIDTLGVSLLSTSFFYTYVLLQIPAGMLIDRIQPRYCITACFLGIACVTIMFACADTLGVAKSSRILQGVFSAPSVVPALFLAAMWFPAKRFALLTGLTEMIGMLGSAIGQAVLAPICGSIGWRHAMFVCAILGMILATLSWFIIRNKPEEKLRSELTLAPRQSIFRSLLIVISYPQAWINGLFSGVLFAVSAAFASFWCIPYLIKIYGISLNMAAAASSMTLFGVALGAPILGWISDKLGLRRMPMIISTAIVLAVMLMVLYIPDIPIALMFALLFVLGFFSSAYALPFAVMRDIVPANVRGTAMGFTNLMCILVGAPILQPLIGYLLNAQHAHDLYAYQHALSVLPICLGLGLVLAFCIEETYCGKFLLCSQE